MADERKKPQIERGSERAYIISEQALKTLFIGGVFVGVLVIVVLLVIIASRPHGQLQPLNASQYQQTLQSAAKTLSSYGKSSFNPGRYHIPIDQAITLVAQRGLDKVGTEIANAAQAQGAAPSGGAQAAGFDQQLGATTYNNCAACHQATGQGIPGTFPPLAGHLPDIYNVQGGRTYLIHAVLFGVQGQISVKGQSYNGTMPAWKQLSDEQIAAVLDHELTSWGNDKEVKDFKPIQPSEVKAERSKNLTSQQVYEARQKLNLK